MCGSVPPDSESSEPPDLLSLHLMVPPSLMSSPPLLLPPLSVLLTPSSLPLLAFPSPYPPSSSSPASPHTRQVQTSRSDLLMASPPCQLSLQEFLLSYPPAIWSPNTLQMSQATAQPSWFATPAWSNASPGMVRVVSDWCVPMFCPRRVRELKLWEFFVGLKVLKATDFGFIFIKYPISVSEDTFLAAMQGSTYLSRQWEFHISQFHISGVTQAFLHLKLGSFFSCMRCVAALCRILPWFISVPLTSSNMHVVWVSTLSCLKSAMERSQYFIKIWWCFLVELPPMPPVPPDPPDPFLHQPCVSGFWTRNSAVLTLSIFGDMSFVTALSYTAFIPPFTQGSILSTLWNDWNLTGLGSIARSFVFRLKPLSLHLPEVARLVLSSLLPLYEDLLPLYEDLFTALCRTLPRIEDYLTALCRPLPRIEDHRTALCRPLPRIEDLDILPLYEDFVTLPLYEDLGSFVEFFTFLYSPFVSNDCVARSVITGSFVRCLIASVAILEIGNCALVAVPISGVRSSTQDFTLLNNSIVEEIRGLLQDLYLFKCYVVIIPFSFSAYVIVISACYAFVVMLSTNTYSFYGD